MIYCPSCSAELLFDISSQMMVCEHCKNSFVPDTLSDDASNNAQTQPYYESYAYVCPSCGAEVETTDKNDAVGFCPYCKGSSMIFDRLCREWKPDGIVPFKITKEQCKEMYNAEVKKYFFVSRKYKEPELIESFRGIYMPYCRFAAQIDGNVVLQAKSKEENIGDYNYRTLFYDLRGRANYTVTENIAHDVSAAFDDHISERLGEYNETDIKKFHPAYLSGFYAESGNVDINEYTSFVQDDMMPYLYDEMKNAPEMQSAAAANELTIDSDYSKSAVPMRMKVSNRRLFPVWFMSYRQGKKITYAAVNGQTGKVAADLPLSPLRILISSLPISAVVFALLFIGMGYLPTLPASATLGICCVLGLVGMYVLQHCYIRTVGTALHQKETLKRFPVGFIVNSILELVGIILFTTDGTYNQYRYMLGIAIAGFSAIPLFAYFFEQLNLTLKISRTKLTGVSMQSNGILVESKRFNRLNTVMRIVTFLTIIRFILRTVAENFVGSAFDSSSKYFAAPHSSTYFYSLAAVVAAELFVLTLIHIMFQSRIAQRRLPQFNKKGAVYDKN